MSLTVKTRTIYGKRTAVGASWTKKGSLENNGGQQSFEEGKGGKLLAGKKRNVERKV